MISESKTQSFTYGQLAYQSISKGSYSQACELYEQAITDEPDTKSHYWYLGLALLLQGEEAEAQTTWMLAMAEGEPEEIDLWTTELIEVLETEAQQQQRLEAYTLAWTIRQHIKEIAPTDVNNLLEIILLSLNLEKLSEEELNSLGIIDILESEPEAAVDDNLLLKVIRSLLNYSFLNPSLVLFVKACLPYIQAPLNLIEILLPASIQIAYSADEPLLAAELIELCLPLSKNNLELLRHLASFYQQGLQYTKGIEVAKLCCELSTTIPDKVIASHILLRGLLSAGGYWQEALLAFHEHKSLLLSLIEQRPIPLDTNRTVRLLTASFFLPYLQDNPQVHRPIQNQVVDLCQANIQIYAQGQADKYRQGHLANPRRHNQHKRLKIGYLSTYFKRHSVGWLARWLFKYHDRDRFDIYGYFINSENFNDHLQLWYFEQVTHARKFGFNGVEIAEQIYQDEVDILIDLDSITVDISCEVMALKPAPIQATWLGLDASGLPSIDYFIADPYVLPESAQNYYTEKIWRLPQTYVAIDGFEVNIPTLRRDALDIPSDAVVYLCGQKGFKRHPDTVRLQLKIIKEVPNSYFLIKGLGEEESIKQLFIQIAEEEGVSSNRLRFLPEAMLEEIHRANLSIADIVLDTYPYNGATTTLETLWMEIPLVTRVGEQFAARNSYTFLINAGVTEGIAWTDEEYVEWGVRLGKDETLRQQVAWKLHQSKQRAPLWNAKQFTREMEKAYEQMWQKYVVSV